MTTVFLNGQKIIIAGKVSLFDFLSQNNLAENKGTAVAVNQEVIPKDLWKETKLNNNDKILIITATQGG